MVTHWEVIHRVVIHWIAHVLLRPRSQLQMAKEVSGYSSRGFLSGLRW